MTLEKLIKSEVLGLQAYFVEEPDAPVKLDANENPYSLPEEIAREAASIAAAVPLNRYPEAGSPRLRKAAAVNLGVQEDMILVGNGSDECIQILLTALRNDPDRGVLIPAPTFAMYGIGARAAGHRLLEIPLDGDFDLDLPEMLLAIERADPVVTFISYPNNPTGNCFDRRRIEAILEASRGLVVVDEAYVNFSGTSFIRDIAFRRNLVILRTLSKVGFAALRLGILVARPEMVHELNKVRLPYNVNSLSQRLARLFFDHEEVFLRQAAATVAERERLMAALEALKGVHPYRSDANFILFCCQGDKNRIYKSLLEEGVLIKTFSGPPALRDCLRVTVGTEEENNRFLRAMAVALR